MWKFVMWNVLLKNGGGFFIKNSCRLYESADNQANNIYELNVTKLKLVVHFCYLAVLVNQF